MSSRIFYLGIAEHRFWSRINTDSSSFQIVCVFLSGALSSTQQPIRFTVCKNWNDLPEKVWYFISVPYKKFSNNYSNLTLSSFSFARHSASLFFKFLWNFHLFWFWWWEVLDSMTEQPAHFGFEHMVFLLSLTVGNKWNLFLYSHNDRKFLFWRYFAFSKQN